MSAAITRRSALLREWAGVFSSYFTTQGLTQAAGLAAGLLLVNFLPVGEFAFYTLATSVLTFFFFTTDLGSTSSLLYFFHDSAKEGTPFEPYVAALFSLRRTAFLIGALGIVTVFPLVAMGEGYSGAEVALATAAVLAAAWFQMEAGIRILALRLGGRYGASYLAEMASGVARLVLAAGIVASGLRYGWLAMATTALAAALMAALARRAHASAHWTAGDIGRQRRAILRYLLPTLPGAAYYSVQGPLIIWLAATFGSTTTMAEAGALGRLGLVLATFSGLTSVIFLPRLARIADERLYRRRFSQFGAFLLFLAVALLAAAWLQPGAFLILIGPHYAGLNRELLLAVGAPQSDHWWGELAVAGAGVSLLGGYVVGVNVARSWTRWTSGAVVILVATQALLVAVLPLDTTAGVLAFGLMSTSIGLMAQLVVTAAGFLRPQWVKW